MASAGCQPIFKLSYHWLILVSLFFFLWLFGIFWDSVSLWIPLDVLKFLCRTGVSQIHTDLPISVSLVLGLKVSVTTIWIIDLFFYLFLILHLCYALEILKNCDHIYWKWDSKIWIHILKMRKSVCKGKKEFLTNEDLQTPIFFNLYMRDWKDGSAVNSACSSSRGLSSFPELISGSQLSVPALGHLMPSADFGGYLHTYVHTHKYNNFWNSLQFTRIWKFRVIFQLI